MQRPAQAPPSDVTTAPATGRTAWTAPRLLRMGSVAALTSKIDNQGKNDGGSFPMRRT